MRYRTDDLPPGKVGAFMPLPAIPASPSAQGLTITLGAPGTFAIDSPSPDSSLPTVSAQHGINSSRPSDVSPDVIFPILYQASPENMGPGVRLGMSRRRRAELPMPAGDWTRNPQSNALIVTKGSRVTLPWPRAFQRYPTQGN